MSRRLTERERLDRTITGGQLTRDIIREARRLGWLAHHSRPGLYAKGGRWATQLSGDAGLPDLVLVRPPEVLFVEVKRQLGDDLSADQARWAAALTRCPGIEFHVVRPSGFETLCRRLAGKGVPQLHLFPAGGQS